MPDDYSFQTHAVFEASAGTGKTYKIERLLIQAVVEKGVAINRILVVTYTEKAAGELKDRLRAVLERELDQALAQRKSGACVERLKAALENYDHAQISTIHAFCLRVLNQNPFSHKFGGRSAMADERDIIETCLRRVQRSDWRKQFGSELVPIMDLSGFTNTNNGGKKWEKTLMEVASHFREKCGHVIEPAAIAQVRQELEKQKPRILEALQAARKLVDLSPCRAADHPLYAAYGPPNRNRDARRRTILLALLNWICDEESLQNPVSTFAEMLTACRKNGKFNETHFEALLESADEESPSYGIYAKLAELLNPLCSTLQGLQYQLTVQTIGGVIRQMEAYKLEQGLQSFEDFLTRVSDVLESPGGAKLLAKLRSEYSIAIVDEFQDTDPVQWKIFKSLFMQSGGDHKLVVVGDPKQAIYGFRNADINTYLQARKHICGENEPHRLTQNFRSSKEIIDALNCVFKDGEMFSSGDGITYENIDPAPEKERTKLSGTDHSGRRALTLLTFPGADKPKTAARAMAQFVGDETERLLRGNGGRPAFSFISRKTNGMPRELRASDIAVLVFKRKEALAVEEQFRAHGIPYTFYKKKGIWQSDEAVHLGFVLKALARCGDEEAFRKMLLTRFFALRPGQISGIEESAAGQAIRSLYSEWRQLAAGRHWAELFRSILEDTGAFWSEGSADDGARRLANYRHILQTLASRAYQSGKGLLELVELLEKNRVTRTSEDESDLQPVETERAAVQIMTVHACKGLEFPVVFLAGGFTTRNSSVYLKYHDNKGRIVFHLDTNDADAKDLAKTESRSETQRLLYVALTRAMLKVYVPFAQGKAAQSTAPLKAILSPVLEKAQPEKHKDICTIEPVAVRKTPGPKISKAEGPVLVEPVALTLPTPLLPEINSAALLRQRIEVRSFSRMVHGHGRSERFGERDSRSDDDLAHEAARDLLPPGISAGDTLHAIMEHIDFARVQNAGGAAELLEPSGSTYGLIRQSIERCFGALDGAQKELRLKHVAGLVFKTLRTPLKTLQGSALCSISAGERLHELEFHMPFDVNASGVEEITRGENGFMTGCMDLVFQHSGRWYLLDWKSNLLPHYGPGALEREMKDRRYDLQFRIYIQALRRWMHRARPGADLSKLFGGVFYIFIRGMNGQDDTQGVYFHAPSPADWDEAKLARELRGEMYRRRES
ncbi:MAG TPA: UvrD-helicase domain-containing protein [Planctomycetota bacterium]|nr:UvrD-helicase domain-containing protein [Planctomycetota bacterium]